MSLAFSFFSMFLSIISFFVHLILFCFVLFDGALWQSFMFLFIVQQSQQTNQLCDKTGNYLFFIFKEPQTRSFCCKECASYYYFEKKTNFFVRCSKFISHCNIKQNVATISEKKSDEKNTIETNDSNSKDKRTFKRAI